MTIKLPKKFVPPPAAPETPASLHPRHMSLAEGDQMLTLHEAATFSGYAKITLRRWIRGGDLVAYRAHGKGAYRILKSDLLKILIIQATS